MSRRINREGPVALRVLARRSLLSLLAVSTAATICVLPVTPAAASVNPLGVALAAPVATAPVTTTDSPSPAADPAPAAPSPAPAAPSPLPAK